jgi:hypothetical protein
MKRTLIGGVVLALVAAAAVYIGDALNLGLGNPLLGVGVGGALALAPGDRKLGRLAGFLVGVILAVLGYGLNAQFLPASSGGVAVTAIITLGLATAAAALSFGRMPLWSLLLGVGAFVGSYDYVYNDKPYDFLSSAPTTLGAFLVTFGIGYLAAALVDWLFPEEEAQPEASEPEMVSVGSEG